VLLRAPRPPRRDECFVIVAVHPLYQLAWTFGAVKSQGNASAFGQPLSALFTAARISLAIISASWSSAAKSAGYEWPIYKRGLP
jgi:hypothetical protein